MQPAIRPVNIRLQITIGSIIFIASCVGLSAFENKSFKENAFSIVCFFYNLSILDIHLKDVVGIDRNLDEEGFKNWNNWTTEAPYPPTFPNICSDGQYLCAICYDDNWSTLAQALNTAWIYYVAMGGLPHNSDVDPSGVVIKTYRQQTFSNH